MNKLYEIDRKRELKSVFTDFNYTEVLKAASNNDYWKDKAGLWSIISAACNDAASEFFVNMNEYIQNLIDIDTCNIHALKSMAKSVKAEHLTDFISENYPDEILKLINLFSIPKHILLGFSGKLNFYSVAEQFGSIDFRNFFTNIDANKYTLQLLLDINKNIDNLYNLLAYNNISLKKEQDPNATLYNIFGEEFSMLINNNEEFVVNEFKNLDIYQLCEKIKKITEYNPYLRASLIISNNAINYYYVLIQLFKLVSYNRKTNSLLQTSYYDKQSNSYINMTQLYLNMVETIKYSDFAYIHSFIVYHFYGLFYDNLINDGLKSEWLWYDEIPNFQSLYSEYTADEFYDKISVFLTPAQSEEFIKKITNYKQQHINFLQYLSLVNNYLKDNNTKFNYSDALTIFNNDFGLTSDYNKELRRLLGYTIVDGKLIYDESNDILLNIAKEFTDIALQISYARESIKTLIQQYSFIGTNKIANDIVRDYFIKNFSNRKDWRYVGNTLNDTLYSDIQTINELNGLADKEFKSSYFNVDLVEYYDPTLYFNIYSELPSCIIDYHNTGNKLPVISSYITESETISTWVVSGEDLVSGYYNGSYTYGVLSTINDDFGWIIPSSVQTAYEKSIVTVDNNVINYDIGLSYWNSSTTSSIFIPMGTEVSAKIPAGEYITVTSYVDEIVPITGLCGTFIHEYNTRFWERDFSKEDASSQQIIDEIAYYENFFDELKNALTNEEKFKVYSEEIYPLLTKTWSTFATSGFLSNPVLSAMQIAYAEQYNGRIITQNIANGAFTTIAPIPYVKNLIEYSKLYDDSTLFLAKPFYDNISYYLSLLTKEILDMHSYDKNTGYGIPIDGWKQSYIEFKGYNTAYENSNNKLNNSEPSEFIDVDGPWVYTLLQEFIKLYLDEDNNISYKKIKNYVDSYYLVSDSIKDVIAQQLYAYQHQIFNKQYDRIFEFQFDQYDNQYTLFKNKTFNKYEDAGEIWVRLKNYPLSMPLMNYCKLYTSSELYTNDTFDILQCNIQRNYANMWKQLCNNAVNFGVIQSTIWILGYTNYVINSNQNIIEDTNKAYLKLGCVKFNLNESTNKLELDILSMHFFSTGKNCDYLTHINEYVGNYLNSEEKSIEFVLYDHDTYINYFDKNTDNKLTTIPLQVFKYSLIDNKYSIQGLELVGYTPTISLMKTDAIVDYQTWKYSPDAKELLLADLPNQLPFEFDNYILLSDNYDYIGKTVSGLIDISNSNVATLYGTILIDTISSIINDITEFFVSGIITDNNSNTYTFTAPIELNNSNLMINKTQINTSIEFVDENDEKPIELKLLKTNLYGDYTTINTISENIWKLNCDFKNVNIAYEAFNTNLSMSQIYNIIQYANSTVNTYYIGVIKFTCPLTTALVTNNDIYLTGIKSIKCEWITKAVESTNNMFTDDELLALNNSYPNCYLTNDNALIIETLVTTLGGNKYLASDYISPEINPINYLTDDERELLLEGLVKNENKAITILQKQLKNNKKYKNNTVDLSNGLTELIDLLDDEYDIDHTLIDDILPLYDGKFAVNLNGQPYIDKVWETWEIDLYKNYEKYLNTNDLKYLDAYNNDLNKLSVVTKFTPAINTCLIEPLKIICNFGNSIIDITKLISTYDLDIKIFLDDEAEQNKAVGWRCGYKQTKYLNWYSNDNKFAGPEIVFVDLDTYKTYNKYKKSVNIIINICWNGETSLEGTDVILDIAWKGYLFKLPLKDIMYNNTCCDNLTAKVNVDLVNNIIKIIPIIYIPVISTYKYPENPEFTMSFGYIKLAEDDWHDLAFSNTYLANILAHDLFKNINHVVGLPSQTKDKNYYIFPILKSTSKEEVIKNIHNFLDENWQHEYKDKIYKGTEMITESISLIWEERVKLKLTDKLERRFVIYNLTQNFVDTKLFN